MSEKKMKRNKRLVSIFVRTAIDLPECEEIINKCLEKIDLTKFEIVLCVERANIRVVKGFNTAHVVVIGDSEGGMVRSGLEELCKCLQTSGYFIHFVPAYFSFVPRARGQI